MTTEALAKKPEDYKTPEDWKGCETIKLAGRDWAVAPMTGRTIAKFTAMVAGLGSIVGPSMMKGEESVVEANMEKLYRVIHLGLARAYPDLTFDDFYDMPIIPDQLFEAFTAVTKASGMEVKKVQAGEDQAAPAEADQASQDSKTS